MEKRYVSKKRLLLSFVIATIVFIIVLIISYSLSYLEFQRVATLQGHVAYGIFEDKLDYNLFGKESCSQESFQKVSDDLHFQGRIIDDLEKKLGKNDKNVLLRKQFYTLIELEHFEFVNFLNENCNSDIGTILFFYSNENNEVGNSEDVGKLLSFVHSKVTENGNNLIIYSFDINLDSALMSKLKEKYGIENSPTLVVDGEYKIFDPKNPEDIEKYLDLNK